VLLLPAVNDWKDPKRFKSDNNDKYSSKKRNDDNDNDDNNDRDESEISEEMRLLLKFPSESSSCPSGCESFQKGDCWCLWSVDAAVRSEREIMTELGLSGEKSVALIQTLKLQYLDDVKKGYSFPFAYGILWKPVWLVRSIWYSISDKGMLGVTNLDGTIKIPVNAKARLPSGKTKGALDKVFSGVRLNGDLISLTAIDLLLTSKGAILKHNQSQSRLASKHVPLVPLTIQNNNNSNDKGKTLSFDDLLKCEVFNTMLRKPTPITSNSSSTFPTLPREVINPIMREVMSEFNLNSDQRAVVVRVSKWFEERKKDNDGRSDDNIILVHG